MNKFLTLLALLSLPTFSYAAGVQFGRIVDIKGSGFISYEGQTHEIKKGEAIYVNSELIIEHSGQVTFTDNADHRFHLGNASSAAVFAGKVELRSGDLWVQSINKQEDYKLTSANAIVNYQGGEAIFSYDSVKGKTQLMVINGLMKLSNLRAPELNLTVGEGNFSFVDQDFEEGMPRDPTPVGEKTYGQLVSMFPGISPMDAHSAEIFKDKGNKHETKGARGIASVATHEDKKSAHELEKEYKKEVMKIKKEEHKEEQAEHVATALVSAETKSVTKVTSKRTTPNTNKLVVKFYGLEGSATSATTAIYDIPAVEKTVIGTPSGNRAPASVVEYDSTSSVLDQAVPKDTDMKTIPTTPQYKESDKLIQELNKL